MMQTTIESLHWRQRWRQLSVDRMGWRSNSSQVLTTFRTSYVKYFEQFNRRGPHHLHLPDSHRLPKLLKCSCAMIDNSMLCVTLKPNQVVTRSVPRWNWVGLKFLIMSVWSLNSEVWIMFDVWTPGFRQLPQFHFLLPPAQRVKSHTVGPSEMANIEPTPKHW